jgi:hypothetical protein
MTSDDMGQHIINNDSLNMFNIFSGCQERTVFMKQIKKNGKHAWGGSRVRGQKITPSTVVDTGSFDCFNILSTKKNLQSSSLRIKIGTTYNITVAIQL